MIRLLALGMAVISFAIGAYFAAICLWLVVTVVISKGQALLLAGLPILFAGFVAVFFFLAGSACLMTARADKKPEAGPAEEFK